MEKNICVPELDMDYKRFLDKSTVLLGPSKTGKSTIILDILYILKDYIDQIIVISPMDKQNRIYSNGICPLPMIWYDITIEQIETIWTRQQALTQIYTKSNNPDILRSLFNKIPNNKMYRDRVDEVNNLLAKYKSELNEPNAAIAESKYNEQKNKCQELIILIFKQAIERNKDILSNMRSKLTKDEIFSLEYSSLNPKVILIFDDASELLKQYAKHETMSKLFTTGRWNNVTFIIGIHGDTALPPMAKKNVFNTIFTDEPTAHAYFERKTNDYDKESKKRALEYCKHVFSPISPYHKLVYVREESKYYKYKATIRQNFRFGSPILWSFCEKIQATGNEINTNNKFISEFMI